MTLNLNHNFSSKPPSEGNRWFKTADVSEWWDGPTQRQDFFTVLQWTNFTKSGI